MLNVAQSTGDGDWDPFIDIDASFEVGAIAGLKFKIFGIGAGAKAGVSYELMNGSLRNGTSYLNDLTLKGSYVFGPLGIDASKSLLSEDASIGGNIFFYNMNADVYNFKQSITILDISAYFIAGGSLKISIPYERVIIPMRPDDYRVKIDNTSVAPRILYP